MKSKSLKIKWLENGVIQMINEKLAEILEKSDKAKISNEYCLALFYKEQYGIESLADIKGKVPKIQSVLRMIRRLKQLYPRLKGDFDTQKKKEIMQDDYKEIGVSIPFVQRVF